MEQGIVDSCPNAIQGSANTIFLTLINALMLTKCNFAQKTLYPPDYGPQLKNGDNFDFIVVGAGSAGSVVTNRLSENTNWKVLLIEAGSYPSPDSEVPGIAFTLQKTQEDWQYHFEPAEHLRFKEKMLFPRGKGLGGSSLINYMLYLRGHRRDYDSWAEAGNAGWDYKSVLPLFEKFENVQDEVDTRYGKHGELRITKSRLNDRIKDNLFNAYKELGYSNDYSEEEPLAALISYATTYKGKRYSAAKAFLGKTVKNRQNLFITLNSQVSKLLIGSNLTVEGVELRLRNRLLKIYANKEVILSAGSINSPQILMNSGIGPKTHLQNLGIKVIKNLKVGENLQDHIFYNGLNYKLDRSALLPISETHTTDALYNYFMHGEGYLGDLPTKFFGFINPQNNSKAPSLQIFHLLQPMNLLTLPSAIVNMQYMQLPESVIEESIRVNKLHNNIMLLIGLSYPKSRGKVLLRSIDPFDKPLIFTNYLSKKEDVVNIIEGIRFLQKLMKTKSLKEFAPEVVRDNLPDCHGFNYDSDEYWECMVRNLVRTIFHVVGTCKMGPITDPDAVVDSRLRVYGINGVRVIDGSIMPTLVGVNTNGPIIMIGEKGAQMIKEDWKKKNDDCNMTLQ